MNRIRTVGRIFFSALCALSGEAATFDAFGPETYVRGEGRPVLVRNSFSVPAADSAYTMTVFNGGENGEYPGVSSARIVLNGKAIVSDRDFFDPVETIVRQLQDVEIENELLVLVKGDVGGAITIVITAELEGPVDTSPPRVAIASPPDGFVTMEPTVAVSGAINDIVVGTVNAGQCTVTVNGVPADVANRSFLAIDVPLEIGTNLITATGVDRAGNSDTATITVIRVEVMDRPRIAVVGGNQQTGFAGEVLDAPVVVEAVAPSGASLPGTTMIFKIVQNNGMLIDDGTDAPAVAVTTDEQGRAAVSWRLGTRSGAGNQRVEVSAVGFAGPATVSASALARAPHRIHLDGGNNQVGVAGQPLAAPMVAIVTDAGHNRLPGVPVTFGVMEGGGTIAGQTVVTVETDSDGRALAVLTLGPDAGYDNNIVGASFADNTGAPVRFVASGRTEGDPSETRISGFVFDNTDRPIPGVTLHVDGTTLTTETNGEGLFLLEGVPVGDVLLVADGSTASRPGTWPTLEYHMVTIAGQDNTLGMPIYLLPIDIPNQVCVSETEGGTLMLPHIPGFELEIPAGSATFPDGSREGCVSVTAVHPDKIPMTPGFGQQPRLIVTIQPPGVHFDPPAPITLPNADGLAPRQVTELYSFDHDLGQFVSIGTGSVSADGSVLRSDLGVGIIKAGWHCGGDPTGIGTCEHECDDGNDCTADFMGADAMCQHPPLQPFQACRDDAQLRFHCNYGTPTAASLVRVNVGRSCGGQCQADATCGAQPFSVAEISEAACGAIGYVFDDPSEAVITRPDGTTETILIQPCIADPPTGEIGLRETMQGRLFVFGLNIECTHELRLSSFFPTTFVHAEAHLNSHELTIRPSGMDEPSLESLILHEMVHAVGGADHGNPIDFATDKAYGCEVSCLGTDAVPELPESVAGACF